MKKIVSFSGGKDSTAMLLMMIERNMKIDEIIFCDTGEEFEEMYRHIEKVETFISRPITRLNSSKSFEYYMLEHQKKNGDFGYGFPDFRNRWCTQVLKKSVISKYLRKYESEIIEYHGIAADEPKRLQKNKEKNIVYPLYEWGISEKEALNYCYNQGFDWEGLYERFKRVSCWLCPLQSLKELKSLYMHYPHLWSRLKYLQSKAFNRFRLDYTFEELEARFERELFFEKNQISITF